MHVLAQIGFVALGSALGGLLRWGIGVGFGRLFGLAFPWGTFFINISGSLFLGWLSMMLKERLTNGAAWIHADNLHLLLAVGFTGAYTTFSTFEFEAHSLLRDNDGLLGLTYIFGSVFLGLVAVRLGMLLARGS
ncbi:MAG: CrcB family protein [Planctomycetes bacterium]|nr:CrcB family protein [Planctomycetota bacterium]